MMIEGPDFVSLLQCKPDDGPNVREFAAKINNAALSYPVIAQNREQAVGIAQRLLEQASTDRSGIVEAERRLHAATSDTKRVDDARSRIESTSTRHPDEAQGNVQHGGE